MTNDPLPAFDTLLVANRGEIACRIVRTARAMGLRTIAVFSDADSAAPHVAAAHDAVRLGPAPAGESYLRIDRVIEAAVGSGAGAIHPGYGFLAENADFAEACAAAGITFVGPTPHAIRAMGDKAAAKRLMQEAGVPLLPGHQGPEQDDARLVEEAAAIGVPLMVKASAGGGGKGMRLVTDLADLPDAIAAARREALGAFGSDVLILERALLDPRHVEIQVLADTHGTTLFLGERDCSVQRRHQKVVEEAPSPAVDADLRARMGAAAVAAADSVGYVGAGTVEFLLQDGDFHFLEMNTRLQVEHPVTEFVTGLDLVEWQLRIARGEALTFGQDDVRIEGHAIEVRLYAEDPGAGFLPATGTVAAYELPPGVRVDSGVRQGSVVGSDYDPMLAKVIAHGPDRESARVRLASAMSDLTLLGFRTNRSFLVDVLEHPMFAKGPVTTAFLDRAELPRAVTADGTTLAALAALLDAGRIVAVHRRVPGLATWSSTGVTSSTMHLEVGAEVHELVVERRPGETTVVIGEDRHVVSVAEDSVTVDGRRTEVRSVFVSGDELLVRLGAHDWQVRDVLLAPPSSVVRRGGGILLAPMHGTVTAVLVEAGQGVTRGDRLAIVEAMKMEHVVIADLDGTIEEVAVAAGDQVAADALLLRIVEEVAT